MRDDGEEEDEEAHRGAGELPVPDEEALRAVLVGVGSLSIAESGRTRFLGPAAGSAYFEVRLLYFRSPLLFPPSSYPLSRRVKRTKPSPPLPRPLPSSAPTTPPAKQKPLPPSLGMGASPAFRSFSWGVCIHE
jgi:hypothetical protein